ncbi:ADP-ribosylation factor-related protein 1 [Hordeum vulgare]|nr:ADP-ribosylation factor-related protein 1 [Hordeum vulgare]
MITAESLTGGMPRRCHFIRSKLVPPLVSSSGRRRGSVKEEAASSPLQANAPFTIAPRPAGHRDRQDLSVEVCRCYWETRTPVSWSDVHLPNAWHLFADRVPIPLVPTSGRARREEIERRRRLLPNDLYYDPRYAADSTLWDTWLRVEHDVRRASYFVGTVAGPRRAQEVRAHTRVRGLTPTPSPSPSPSPPPPPRMTEAEETRLMQHVMEDSMTTHDERQWPGMDRAMALSAADVVAIPESMEEEEVSAFPPKLVGASWGWSCTAPEMAQGVGVVNWCPHAAAVTGAGSLATGGGAAGRLPARAPRTMDRWPTSGHRRPTLTSSTTTTTTTPATSEDGDNDGLFFMLIMSNWAVLWP